jgi:hypothetical protein
LAQTRAKPFSSNGRLHLVATIKSLWKLTQDNSIPESDEANNRLVQLLPLQVAPRPIVELWLSYPPSPVSPGSQFTLNWQLSNRGAESVPVTLSVSGLPEGWAQIEPVSGILPANGFLNGQVTVTVPNNWAESRDFTVTLQAQANSTTLSKNEIQGLTLSRQLVACHLTTGQGRVQRPLSSLGGLKSLPAAKFTSSAPLTPNGSATLASQGLSTELSFQV